jgi:hypothetical protein
MGGDDARLSRDFGSSRNFSDRKEKLEHGKTFFGFACKCQKLTRSFFLRFQCRLSVIETRKMVDRANESTYLAASLIEDDFHVEDRSELLKEDNNDTSENVDDSPLDSPQTWPSSRDL